jgi:hypothetical protein
MASWTDCCWWGRLSLFVMVVELSSQFTMDDGVLYRNLLVYNAILRVSFERLERTANRRNLVDLVRPRRVS